MVTAGDALSIESVSSPLSSGPRAIRVLETTIILAATVDSQEASRANPARILPKLWPSNKFLYAYLSYLHIFGAKVCQAPFNCLGRHNETRRATMIARRDFLQTGSVLGLAATILPAATRMAHADNAITIASSEGLMLGL